MKEKILFVTAAFAVALLFAFRHIKPGKENNKIATVFKYNKKNIIRCSPDWNELKTWIEEVDIPPIPGAGSYKWKISTKNDSAQFYFNQGINMYYSFHIIEAMASFKKAERFDPQCGMLYWGQALAYGPNINDLGYAASPDALLAAGMAGKNLNHCTEKEIKLIDVQRVRYSADSNESREKLNQDYVDEMKRVYEQFPNDADVAALYADALMLQHPWDLWSIDGTPKPWTPRIREVLEKLLTKTPNHPGANHYYIHVMEPSPFAYKALPSADRLGKLTPGLSHTVHMPSHIYLRTGNYAKGVSVNEAAVNSYKRTIPLYAPVTGADFLYVIHNLHMQTNNAMLVGNYKLSEASALETRKSIPADYLSIPPPMGSVVQYIYMTPVLVNIRFGKWDKLLQEAKPDASQVYANILYHFGRGMAFANQSKIMEAHDELGQIIELMKDSTLKIPFTPFSAAIDGAVVAGNILDGTISMKHKEGYEYIIRDFEKAVEIEENMVYNEPRDWLLNPKHYLGNAYLKNGQWRDAEATFQKDLKNNSENGWALFGLYQALMGQKRKTEANKVLARFKKSFDKADMKLTGAVF
jgi:tetratricopeptide (TPR) repeat protein